MALGNIHITRVSEDRYAVREYGATLFASGEGDEREAVASPADSAPYIRPHAGRGDSIVSILVAKQRLGSAQLRKGSQLARSCSFVVQQAHVILFRHSILHRDVVVPR
jgi:hypothetical protein